MAKAVISSILQSQLGRYVDGLAPESLQVGLWSGELLLTNLKLKPNALAELNLPIQVIQGSIAKVHVLVPWNQLGSASVQITLEGIYGVAVPNNELPTPEEVLVGIRNRLERAELLRQHQRHSTNSEHAGAPKEDETFFTRLTSRIMDNLTITIRDFHIRYEDVTSNPSTPFTFGVLLESFCIETTDEHGTKVFVDRSEAPPDKMHKVATLKNLTVYWDRLSHSTALQTSNTFAASMRSVIYSDFKQLDRRWLLLPPCSLSVRFTKNESQVFTKESPKYRIQSTVRSFALHLSREQYDEMVFMYLAMRSRLAIEAHFWYNRHRPFLSITNYSIVWWDYLVRFHSKNKKLRFRWSVVRKLARDRKMYMALYKQHHLQHIPLTVEQLAYLQRLEDMFPIELTLRLRDVADAQFAKTKSDAASSSSWFGYFFGEGGESSKDVQQDVLSAEGKADLKRAFEETAALELAPVPDDCCIVVLDLTLQMGQVGLFAYQNVPLLTSEFTGSCLFQVQPASRWLAQMQLRRLNVFNWRCADAAAAGRLFCTLQVDDGGSDKKAPFEVSVAATDATGMRVRVSADPIRVVLDAVFLLQLADFFSTHDTLNDVWAYATSSVQSYVFAEHEADMRAAAVVATNKNIVYDVLVDMKAPLVVLPEDPTVAHTSMVVLDLGRFHVRDVPTAAASSATVYAWQIDMTNIEVLLQQQHSSKPDVPIVPGFSVGFAVETSRNLQDTRIPYVTAKASMPSVVVNVGQETIVALGTLHARLLNQCQRYLKATSKPEVASFAPEKGDVEKATDLSVVRLAPQEQASVKFHLTWVVECVHVNIDDSFCVIMHGTWFDYQASSAATTTIGAKLQDLCMEDKCYAPSSPYFYLARTQDSTDLIQLTIATTDAPTRHADVTVDVHFNVLHLQWNPPSIMMLYTMISAYGSSMDDGASADMMVDMSSSSVLSQSTLPTPTTTSTTSTIPALKITASLKQFSISFNKDVLDRRLLTLTVTDASVVYVGEHSGQYNVKGELGDVSGVDYSVVKAPTYSPFFGMDRTAHGCFKQEGGRSPKLVVFEYAMQGGAMLPRLALVLDSIRIVYFHQQVLELVDYLFQGILGTLVNQTLLSATQLIMEPATTLILDIRIDRPKILIPMDPLDVEHFLLQSSRLQVHHTPTTLASYCCGSSLLERVTTATTSHTLPCDFKKVVLEQAGLYSTDGRGGYDNLMATPLTLDISILDIHSTRLKDDDGSTALPRFSIDCVMPHMHVHMSRTHYLMFFRMLSDNIGGASLYQSVAVDNDEDMIMAKSEMAHRPVVVYEYANADLEGATMTVSFRMESFSCCALDIGLTLETTNLTVCLRLLNHINPSLDVSLANAFIADDLLRCESVVTIRYEWSNASDDDGLLLGTSSTLDVALNHLHGKLIPHVLSDISRFFAMDADATAVHDEVTTRPCSEPATQSLAKTPTSFTMNVLATNVQLSLPQSLTDKQPTVELVVAANFNVALESFANHADNLEQKLTLQARDLEALLQNANRQGCSDTLVQLIEPTTVGVTYLGFQHACHHQDKVDVTVSPVEVFLSYEDMRVLADVWTTMQHDMAPAFPSSGPTSATTLSSSKTLPLVPDSEVQRHVTVDVQRMQLTLINDCDGCDMGLVQLELPTCRVFLNATTTHDATTATGGGDISFASSYYNPDSRVWHPLCPEWKVHASAMTNIPHAPTTDQFKSMQWNISADTLHVTATHGLLEALASAGGTLIKSKQLDQTKHDAPCLIQNESGLPIEYWWSSDPSAKTRVQHKAADNIHYVHVKGKGSGVTRTYTSNDKEHGTLCINFVGMDTKPVQGIVVDQLGTRPHALVETCGSLSKLSVTCDTQLVGGHIVLTISSHLRVQSHLSNEVQLLVYDPTWKSPVEVGTLRPLETTYIPIAYSTGSELRVRLNGSDWAYSSPIPIDATSTSTIRVTCTNESKVAVFCVALANGLIQLYEPYVVENKLPVSVMFQVKDAQSLPRGDDVAVGCKSAIWWCRSTPMFAFHVPGCDTTNWLPLLRKRNNDTFSLGLKRLDKQPLTILVVISENKAKATTITLLAEMWIINKTGLDLVYGNDQDDAYSPPKAARSVVDGSTDITLYSTPTTLRVKMMAPASSWTARFKPDPKRMNWQDECLSVTTRQGKLHEFGVSADYATRHFGVLTTLVSITPRYVVVNRTPWTLVVLEDDGLMHTIDTVHHVINAGDAYSLWWTQGKRTAIRASVVGLNGTSSWSDSFSVDKPNTFDLIIPNDEYCPFLQVSVKTGGLSQATFVVDIVRLDSEPDVEQSKWDIISYDINVAGLDLTLSDSTKATSPAFELFGGTGVMSEDVARFRISDIRFDSFKDRLSTNAHLVVASITLEDLLVGTKYPNVLTPAKRDVDFVQFTYMSKRHPKYAYIEELTLWTKDVRVQTSMKFIDRINSVVAHVLGHFASSNTYSVDLLSYFADDGTTEQQQHNTITGRKCFFERCHIYPINVVLSFVRDKKDDRMDHPSAGFWLSNLKFRIKDASIVLDEYTLRNAFATQESVLQAMGAFYVSSIKGQALNLIESIQVTSLVTGVVKDGVSSLVSTLIGKTDTSLASSASFRYESLSNNAIVAKHSDALDKATSPTDFAGVLNHLVYDWDGNHTGLEARACMALGLVNNSRQSVVLQVFLKDGAEFRLLPAGRNYVAGASSPYWTSDRGLIVFAWGYTPTLLTTGDICLQLQSNAFNLYISKSSTRLQPNPGYSATFTVQDKQTWWSKFMIIVGDDLPPSLEVSSTTGTTTSTTGGVIDTYEVLFTTDALGIVAKQDDYQTVVVRECCYFSNGQPGPALATGRITEGDVILSVNGIPIKSTQAFKDIIVNTSRPIVVRFKKASFDLFGEVTPSPAAHKPDHEYSLFG